MMEPTKRKKRVRRDAKKTLDELALTEFTEAVAQAKKVALLRKICQTLDDIRAMMLKEGFAPPLVAFTPTDITSWPQVLRPNQSDSNAIRAAVNPCVECGRDGQWQAPSTRQWFCSYHETLGKSRYADDRKTTTSPTLRVVQTPTDAQRAAPQAPPAQQPALVETADGGTPVLQEQPVTGDVLQDEMNRLMNGGLA